MSRKRQLAYLALGINTVVWGLAAPIVKPALDVTTPERFLFYRFLVASVASVPYLTLYWKKLRLTLPMVIKIAALELVGTLLLLWLIYTALRMTTALESSFIYSTSPLFVTLAGIILLKENETKREWSGLGLALVGTLVMTITPLLIAQSQGSASSLAGNSLVLLQNVLWAGYLVFAKRLYRHTPKLAVTAISFLVGAIGFFFLSWPGGGNPLVLLPSEMAFSSVSFAVFYMAIFGSVIGATTYLFGQNLIEVSEATVFTYLQAVVALPAAILMLHEKPTLPMIAGAALVALGVYLTESRKRTAH